MRDLFSCLERKIRGHVLNASDSTVSAKLGKPDPVIVQFKLNTYQNTCVRTTPRHKAARLINHGYFKNRARPQAARLIVHLLRAKISENKTKWMFSVRGYVPLGFIK